MKALILNSGMGSRMGALTKEHPKCMTNVTEADTILSMQLKLLSRAGIREVVMTTGLFDGILTKYCESLGLPLQFTFVKNPVYATTNYIYSIFLAREHLKDDILLMHGDLVFEESVLHDLLASDTSCMAVSSTLPLPEKDFKAVVRGGRVEKVGIEFFEDAVTAQPLYRLQKKDWLVWLGRIASFCEAGEVKCYAENALNEVSGACAVYALDVKNRLCNEIDTAEDLKAVSKRVEQLGAGSF